VMTVSKYVCLTLERQGDYPTSAYICYVVANNLAMRRPTCILQLVYAVI
jgi:hypothetical protein